VRCLQVTVVALLLEHIGQLEGTALTLLRSQWLFALTAKLDKPIHAETAAALRQMLRHCCHLRAGLQLHDDPLLPLLNILIAISGAYFGQDEEFSGLIESDLY
jgi:gem associated protein 2